MRPRSVLGLIAGAGLVLMACMDEGPTGVGSILLPGGSIRTYELILEPDVFLAGDTAISDFLAPTSAAFRVVAGGLDGLTSNLLTRFAAPPPTVAYVDTAGTTRVDSFPSYFGGRLVLRLDTLRTRAAGPVQLELYRIGEEWDPRSATWTERVDSGQVRLAWSQPGGTRAGLVSTARWEQGSGDSISFAVDSQTVALWADTTDAARGALIAVTSTDARIVASLELLRVEARPSARPDTTVEVTLGSIGRTFVFDPPPPPTPELRIGGLPTWRSYLMLQRLDTLAFPCPGEDPAAGCVLRLDEVKINYAALLLQPVATPAAFVPMSSLVVDARVVLGAPSVPLDRAPLGGRAAASPSAAIAPARFQPGGGNGGTGAVELPVTEFVAGLAAGQREGDDDPPPSMLALLASPEAGDLGFGTFGALGGGSPPRLRLIVSTATRVEIR